MPVDCSPNGLLTKMFAATKGVTVCSGCFVVVVVVVVVEMLKRITIMADCCCVAFFFFQSFRDLLGYICQHGSAMNHVVIPHTYPLHGCTKQKILSHLTGQTQYIHNLVLGVPLARTHKIVRPM